MEHLELKQIRDSLGMSQAALAEALGVRPNTVARWERGESSIPSTVEKLAQLLAKDTPHAERSTQVATDPHHRAILDALNRRVDSEVFELCAADLLREQLPTLVPVRGGGDDGFDGAFVVGDVVCPLITTTSQDFKGNLQRNLRRVLKTGNRPTVAAFATCRRVTPKQRAALANTAADIGVPCLHLYEQDWFARALYRNPSWCKKLLDITGRPSALSPFAPLQRRDRVATLLALEVAFEAMRAANGDTILVGGPGFGKTAVLQVFAEHHGGLFVVDPNMEELANAIREQRPRAIIVDDAHVHDAWLSTLVQLREQIGASFRIVASCWDHYCPRIQQILGGAGVSTIGLPLIGADTVLAIVRLVGLHGPDDLLRLIVRQAEGRPGLAVTLAQLCLNDNVDDVVTGDALVRRLCPMFEQSLGRDESALLACFGVGGKHGIAAEAVAAFLGRSLDSVRSSLAALAPAGIIRQTDDGCVSVWPPPFRWVLVRNGFFGPGALRLDSLLGSAHVFPDAVESLVGSRSRGAAVPSLWQLVEKAADRRVWKHFAWLGPTEALRVVSEHPDLELDVSEPLLHHCPDEGVRRLLDAAIKSTQPDHHRKEVLQQLEHWARDGRNGEEMVARSETLVAVTRGWWKVTRDSCISLSVLCTALSPGFERSASDPGEGRTLTFTSGLLSNSMLKRLTRLWPDMMDVLSSSRDVPWTNLFRLLQSWLHPNAMVPCDTETISFMRDFGKTMLADLARSTRWHHGVQHRLAAFALIVDRDRKFVMDRDFAVLYPLEDVLRERDWEKQARERQKRIEKVAPEWLERDPAEVAKILAQFEREANEASIHAARMTSFLCEVMARETKAPSKYVEKFVDAELAPGLVWPFLLALRGTKQFDKTLLRLSRIASYSSLSLELALVAGCSSLDVVDECISRVLDPAGLVETCCRRTSELTLRHLLNHQDPGVATAAAIGEWTREKGESIRAPDEWRAAVVRSAAADNDHGARDYWLERILRSDSALSCDWLCALASTGKHVHYGNLELAKKAISGLDAAQKRRFIGVLHRNNGLGEVAARVIGDDVAAYEELLKQDRAKDYHLSPLLGPPAGLWGDKVALALAKGYTEQQVLDATLPTHWSYSGSESSYWSGWSQAFERWSSHVNVRVQRVATRGREDAQRWVENCQRREHLEAVRGIGAE
jgi:transcriptional regulator with XRE-family HTH domain